MLLDGTHRTTYHYSAPVYLEPHTFRLRPRSDPNQTVHNFEVEIDPVPEGLTQGVDAYGSAVLFTWFSGTHEQLEIRTHFVVETHRGNPFDFIAPTLESAALPPVYSEAERLALTPYFGTECGPAVRSLAEGAAVAAGRQLVPFLAELATRLYDRCEVVVRPEGDPLPAESVLSAGSGSCRDLTVVYMEACRHAGVAARFVSGYQYGGPEASEHDLHAWAGAYVPGGGWRGYDPTHGLAVGDHHIALAAAAAPAGAAPAAGSYRGTGVTSELSAWIDLRAREEGS